MCGSKAPEGKCDHEAGGEQLPGEEAPDPRGWDAWLPSYPSHQVPSDFTCRQSAWSLDSYNPF